MIGRLSGTLIAKQPPMLLLDVGGVGYEIEAPMSTFFKLPALGSPVVLQTHLVIREDAHLLFGFGTAAEKALFREVIRITGIGPKLALAILSGIGGSLAGALFNYWLAMHLGRPFLLRYGKYVLFKEHSLQRMEDFFARHGHISTFTGRLIPAVRQYISLPAGLARMNLAVFSFYTALGAGIWVTILAVLGYSLGHNEAAIRDNLQLITFITLGAVAVIILLYVRIKLKKKIIR